jgi:RHS repeat-associated protein
VGQKTTIGGSLAHTGLPAAFSNATYNAANQLVQWNGATLTYDGNGNLTSDGSSTYTWNARNQLVSINGPAVAAFSYDAVGQRVVATQINSRQQAILFDGANAVKDENYATGTHSYLTDGLNSTLALADAGGTISSQYTYDPFGNTMVAGAASTNNFQFSGRENDGTGLYYLRARYYSLALGRFVSQDPIGEAGGMNFYSYAGNDPIDFSDPAGNGSGGPGEEGGKELHGWANGPKSKH